MRTDEERGEYATEIEDSLNNARAMIGWDRGIEIEDDGDLKKYRIELPNLYDDAGLDPFEFRLLAHYKRVGKCTESTRTTADTCKMSPAQVSIKRKSLHKKNFILMQKVSISKREFSYKITVVDRWQENFTKYFKRLPDKQKRLPHETKKVVVAVDTKNIFTAYESEIGLITPAIADSLNDWSNDIPVDWIFKAIHEAAVQNKRNWKYCEAILKRWKAQKGTDEGKEKELPPEYRPFVDDRAGDEYIPNPKAAK